MFYLLISNKRHLSRCPHSSYLCNIQHPTDLWIEQRTGYQVLRHTHVVVQLGKRLVARETSVFYLHIYYYSSANTSPITTMSHSVWKPSPLTSKTLLLHLKFLIEINVHNKNNFEYLHVPFIQINYILRVCNSKLDGTLQYTIAFDNNSFIIPLPFHM